MNTNLPNRPVPVRSAFAQLQTHSDVLICLSTFYGYIKRCPEKVPHLRKLGNRWLISPSELHAFLKGLDLIIERKT
jgi:hypothetical protein